MAAQQLSQLVDISKPQYVITEVKKLFFAHYKKALFQPINRNFLYIQRLFSGAIKGYRKCNTEYHDLRHTLDTFLAAARLMDGHNLSGEKFDVEICADLLQAALFHDTGYIQEDWDVTGTGAKYTQEHVQRGTVFVEKNAGELGFSAEDVRIINSYITCSHPATDFDKLYFMDDAHRTAGAILGTSDILGQMADRVYLEKLLFLYYEFREAGIPGYHTEFDIIRKTLDFYWVVRQKLDTTFGKVYEYALPHFRERYGITRNLYLDAIENNISYVKKIIDDTTSNFRDKLHRINFK
jgi:hypothetical protein